MISRRSISCKWNLRNSMLRVESIRLIEGRYRLLVLILSIIVNLRVHLLLLFLVGFIFLLLRFFLF